MTNNIYGGNWYKRSEEPWSNLEGLDTATVQVEG